MPHTVRIGVLQGIVELLNEFPVNVHDLFLQANIDVNLLSNDDNLIPSTSMLKLLELAYEATQCQHFGLLLASRQESTYLGLIGLLMESSTDLGSAFKKVNRYFRLHAQGAAWHTSCEGDFVTHNFTVESSEGINSRPVTELAVGQSYQMIRELSNNNWQPLQVCFHFDKPKNDRYYKHYFNTAVIFNSEIDGFIFKKCDLKLKMPKQNERIHSALKLYADSLNKDNNLDLCEQTKEAIRKLLPDGQCSIDNIANLLNCDKRTLQRYLKQYNSSYQELLDDVRYNMAKEYLSNSSMNLSNLASILGYTETSTFSRSFKKQFHISPSEWRKQNQNHT